MTDVSLTLEQAKTILAIKLGRGRPSVEVASLRALAKRVINSHQHEHPQRVPNTVEEPILENTPTVKPEEKIYEPINIEVPIKILTPEGTLALDELEKAVSNEYQKLFDRYPQEMTPANWAEWKIAKDLLLSGWALQRQNILSSHWKNA